MWRCERTEGRVVRSTQTEEGRGKNPLAFIIMCDLCLCIGRIAGKCTRYNSPFPCLFIFLLFVRSVAVRTLLLLCFRSFVPRKKIRIVYTILRGKNVRNVQTSSFT